MNDNRMAAIAGFAALLAVAAPARAQSGDARSVVGPDDLLGIAFEHNPTMRASLLDKDKARSAVRAEEGLYPIILLLDGGFTHSSSPSPQNDGSVDHRSSDSTVVGAGLTKTLPLGTQTSVRVEGSHELSSGATIPGTASTSDPAYGLTAKVGVTQPLLKGAGKTVVQSSWRQALKAEELADHRVRLQASDLISQILNAYWELWYAEHAVEIDRKARDLARTQLEEVEARVAEGDSAPVDALSFQTRLATLEESVVTAEAARDRLSVQLAGLLGFHSNENHMSPKSAELPSVDAKTPDLDSAVRTALLNAPEIREKLAAIAVAEEQLKTAGEEMRPRLDLLGWLQANTLGNGQVSPAFEQFGQGEAYSAYVGLLYELPLDNTRKDAKRASAMLDVDIAGQQLLAARDAVKASVVTLIEDISSSRKRLDLAERTLAVANKQAEAERERYNLGAAIFVQVREAEEAVREAELRTTRARVDLVQAELKLQNLTGKLIERYKDALATKPSKQKTK